MEQRIYPRHETDAQGRPAGGTTMIAIAEDIGGAPVDMFTLPWQNGPLVDPKTGQRQPPNGLFVETLIAAVIDRIAYYQGSPFRCAENAEALAHLTAAQTALRSRTKRRAAAGIEGTHGRQPGHEEQEAAAR